LAHPRSGVGTLFFEGTIREQGMPRRAGYMMHFEYTGRVLIPDGNGDWKGIEARLVLQKRNSRFRPRVYPVQRKRSADVDAKFTP
jgi:hypothetical protein